MKLSDLLKTLKSLNDLYGDTEVQLQNDPKDGEQVIDSPDFFIVSEQYDSGMIINLRTWPY